MIRNKHILNKIHNFISSNLFFKFSLFIYGINSVWIAISALYPMAFDEQYHLGIIKLYSDKLTPFWTSNPPGEAIYGAVYRDPSYLYHYLLSFPYRLLDNLFHTEMSQVLILRFVNILMFGFGIWIFRKVLIKSRLSNALTNSVLLLFILTPIVTLLASQINYDNLLFLITGLLILQTQNFITNLRNNKEFNLMDFILIAITCIFGSLVKYAFLPIALGVVIYLFYQIYKIIGLKNNVLKTYIKSFSKLPLFTRIILLTSFMIMFGLFSERYIVNAVKYHTPTPECDQVLNINACKAYGPWRRNYYTRKAKLENKLEKIYSPSFPRYLITIWLSQTTYHLFFTIDGAKNDFKVGEAFRVLRNSSLLIFILGLILFFYNIRIIIKKYNFGLFGLIIIIYLLTLILQNYLEFLHLGYPFAIQGRYLILILPLFYAILASSFNVGLNKLYVLKSLLFTFAFIILATQGGGAGTFILRSDYSWYWPKQYPNTINHIARNVLNKLLIRKD